MLQLIRRYLSKASVILICGLVLPASQTPALAWHGFGHMEVALVAYQQLTPQTKQRVNALLKKNPYYKTKWNALTKNLPADQKDMMVFMLAATWPDEIKQDNTYQNDGGSGGDVPPKDSKIANANVGYSDTKRHKYWHFIDTAFSPDGTKLTPVPMSNAEVRIGVCRNVLSSNAKDALKSYDLVWLLHLVGDVHQPLHCTTRVTQAHKGGDQGGNLVKLDGNPDQLHSFWDALPGMPENGTSESDATFTAITKAAQNLPTPDATMVLKNAEHDWVAESSAIAEKTVYSMPIGTGTNAVTLDANYISSAKKIAAAQVALAGARLANILNDELN